MQTLKKIAILVLLLSHTVFGQTQSQHTNVPKTHFLNPIFSGDYPDPSILVDGNDYYMVHSSFEYYPGLTIWHSKNLIDWAPVTNALHTYLGSVWAPDLIKHNKKYYIYFPVQETNYVITADRIEGPWSTPVDLKIGNIDPGHIADANGNRYLYFSNGGYVPLSEDGLSVTGPLKHAYDGWPIPEEWSIECFCMEGPKLFKRGEYYYLTVAQGGTAGPATGHMVISARSKSPLGPWENSPYNPIARAESASEQWNSVGHATIFEDAYNDWYMMFHAYENGHYNMGRQTMLSPVEWTADGWFKIPETVAIDQPIQRPKGPALRSSFSLSDDLTGNTLAPQWHFFGGLETDRYSLSKTGLTIDGKGTSVADSAPLLMVPADHSYSVDVELEMEGDAIGGLVLFYNPQSFSGILANQKDIITNLRGWQFVTENDVFKKQVFLRLVNNNHTVDMYYSLDGKTWHKTENSAEVSAMHHNVLSGFLSLRVGLVSTGTGKVTFKNFNYTALN